jgi:hypothetical protein
MSVSSVGILTHSTQSARLVHVRWKRAVKSLDTMAVEATGEASAAEPAAAAAAASQSSSSGASAKVTIDMDEL